MQNELYYKSLHHLKIVRLASIISMWMIFFVEKPQYIEEKYEYNCELTVRHCLAPQITSHHNNNIPQRYRSVTQQTTGTGGKTLYHTE